MAAIQEWAGSLKFTYSVVTIDKNSPLGSGSYGAVYKAKCDELHCAAKVIHETLLIKNPSSNLTGQGKGNIMDKFNQECHFLSELKHPNIVQFLGTHTCRETRGELVLLMELMDENLTQYLKNYTNPLPIHFEIDLCNDIALAVSYLHSNHIIHRDLTGMNVLLYAGRRVKVTDFGVSKLIDPNSLQASSMTMCPGTLVYMPPEALEETQSPHYTEKLDCFSYGVICIQIFTRKFPKPTARYRNIGSPDSTQIVKAVIPETVRRQNHTSTVRRDHLFLPTALECLSDAETDRPSSQELCHRIVLLKEEAEYIESRGKSGHESHHQRVETSRNTIQLLEQELQESKTSCSHLQKQLDSFQSSHRREITHKNNQIQQQHTRIASVEQQHHQKVQECHQKDHEISQLNDMCKDLKVQLHYFEQTLSCKDSTIESLQKQNNELRQDLSQKTHHLAEIQEKRECLASIKLVWRESCDAHTHMRREPDAVIHEDTIYFKNFWGKNVFTYNITHKSWTELPSCPVSSFSMAVLDNKITVIGGKSTDLTPVSTLLSYSKKWVSAFPNMRVERYWTISVKHKSFLIVMGGEGRDKRVLNTVEVLDLNTHQWSFAPDLPRPMDSATAAICGDHLYLGGGSHSGTSRFITACSLPTLLQGTSQHDTWHQIEDLPHRKTTLVSSHDYLFSVGGKDDFNQPTSSVYVYNLVGKRWEMISKMICARSSCYAVLLPINSEIMVVGGINSVVEPEGAMKSVEIAQINQTQLPL